MLRDLECSFHHLGLACAALEPEAQVWTALGYTAEGPDFEDPIQQVRGRFLTGPGPRLELLQPMGPNSPVAGMLKRGVRLYHQAWETALFDRAVDALQESGSRMTAEPQPAIAFGMRRIGFFVLPSLGLIELIEA